MHGIFTEAQLTNCLVLLQEKLKPLMDQLNRVKDLTVPEFGTLQAWEVRANAAARSANGDSNSNDPSKSSQAYNGTPMPFLGETKVKSMPIMHFIRLLYNGSQNIHSLCSYFTYLSF